MDVQLFTALKERMSYLSARHKVIAENVANADTPGYQAKDLKPQQQFSQKMADIQRTNGKHLASQNVRKGSYAPVKQTQLYDSSPDGNGVVLEEQMMKMTENAMEYQMVTGLYRKYMTMMRTALGRRA